MENDLNTNDPKLDELRQRSHDFALKFVDVIFGTLALLLILGGFAAIIAGTLSLLFDRLALGCTMLIGGSLLFVLLTVLRTLKDIRFNTRELLIFHRSEKINDESTGN